MLLAVVCTDFICSYKLNIKPNTILKIKLYNRKKKIIFYGMIENKIIKMQSLKKIVKSSTNDVPLFQSLYAEYLCKQINVQCICHFDFDLSGIFASKSIYLPIIILVLNNYL